ncbi:MAG: entericidin A/B family lipoprotein [Alphaproteobacteria bacterium]|nr:entericidin A/B family lipoprotein [Alphaproteobacteria bacterium]MBU0793585.1 entericidin A/B family lipoprotein [Alphaproteobacteria bacterium]MBU0875584.1 entericidin A/B family lipoprotein [Alphaproteobacteria bacterium]MBU1771289.1 entericidin A/B family lipoprotein [Alphaproteobacteria bacterium]
MNKRGTLILLLGAVFVLQACNAVQGAGRDIESVGQAGEEAIE